MHRVQQVLQQTTPPMSPTNATSGVFEVVQQAPPDAIFGVKNAYQSRSHPNKLNLSVGAYRTNEGKPYVLDIVHKVEKEMAHDASLNKEYLPITGLPEFISLSQKLILGENCTALKEGRVGGAQALSGTGALRVGGNFITQHLGARAIYLSNPTWGNHKAIFAKAGFTIEQYRYFKPSTRGLDLEGMLIDLSAAPQGSVVLLHACAHNPTGVDPTEEEWRKLADVCKARQLIPFFDCAYQGYASGDLAKDAFAVRLFAELGFDMLIAQSYSKNLGLYGERAGCISVVTSSAAQAKAVTSQLAKVIRPMYSNPPRHGAMIAAKVLSDEANFQAWVKELKFMSNRIIEMRQALFKELQMLGTPGDWSHILKQIGMFTFTGLTGPQCDAITERHAVYLLRSGRISMAGLSTTTAPYLARAMDDVVRTVN